MKQNLQVAKATSSTAVGISKSGNDVSHLPNFMYFSWHQTLFKHSKFASVESIVTAYQSALRSFGFTDNTSISEEEAQIKNESDYFVLSQKKKNKQNIYLLTVNNASKVKDTS